MTRFRSTCVLLAIFLASHVLAQATYESTLREHIEHRTYAVMSDLSELSVKFERLITELSDDSTFVNLATSYRIAVEAFRIIIETSDIELSLLTDDALFEERDRWLALMRVAELMVRTFESQHESLCSLIDAYLMQEAFDPDDEMSTAIAKVLATLARP